MQLDFDLHLHVLNVITSAYPEKHSYEFINQLYEQFGKNHVNGNLKYLQMHGIVSLVFSPFLEDNDVLHEIMPTQKAFDVLHEKGGWSAILNVQVVKLHEESIRDLLQQRLNQSDLPDSQKQVLATTISQLPDVALKHLTTKLLDYLLTQSPSVWKWLQTLV